MPINNVLFKFLSDKDSVREKSTKRWKNKLSSAFGRKIHRAAAQTILETMKKPDPSDKVPMREISASMNKAPQDEWDRFNVNHSKATP